MATEVVFGIDLGTTNTVISYFTENKIKILTDGAFKLIPSKVYFSPENKIFCGNYIPIGATNVINSFKVEIGHNNVNYNLKGVVNIFVNHLKYLISKQFNLPDYRIVITVPSNFSDSQREFIRDAFINNAFKKYLNN